MKLSLPLVLMSFMILLFPAVPVRGEPLSTETLREDPRLEKRVTIAAPRVYLGELVERLAKETGVAVTAGRDGDGAGDVPVAVFLTNVRLGEAMNALWSLVSYKGARWHWVRSGSPEAYRYRLARPRAAQLFAAQLGEQSAAEFARHAATMLAAVQATPEEQKALAARDPVAAGLLRDATLHSGLSVFGQALSPVQQAAVLGGQREVTLNVDALPEAGKAFVRAMQQGRRVEIIAPDGQRQPAPAPSWIRFRTRRVSGDTAPVLFVDVENLGGYGCLGGEPFEAARRTQLESLWMMEGDARESPAERQPLPDLSETAAPAVASRRAPGMLEKRLEQVAAKVPLSVLARLPQGSRVDPFYPSPRASSPKTVGEFLDRLKMPPLYLQRKWRGGVVMLTYPAWYIDEAPVSTVPFERIRQLREAEGAGAGLLSLEDLAGAAAALNEGQLLKLATEFPVMSQVAYWRDLLGLYHQSPRAAAALSRAEGLPLQSLATPIRALTDPQFAPVLERAAALRLRVLDHPASDHPTREVRIELVSARGEALASSGFAQVRRPPAEFVENGGFELVETRGGRITALGWTTIGAPEVGPAQTARTGRYAGRVFSSDIKAAGMNYVLPRAAKGTVHFWYNAPRSEVGGQNLVVYLIPMRRPLGVSQAGEFVPEGKPTGRLRFEIPAKHVGDGRWHAAALPFDFKGAGMEYLLFAPRVNELTTAAGAGELWLDDVVVQREER